MDFLDFWYITTLRAELQTVKKSDMLVDWSKYIPEKYAVGNDTEESTSDSTDTTDESTNTTDTSSDASDDTNDDTSTDTSK